MLYYAFLAIGAFLVCLLGTRLTILMLRRKRFLFDIPNARSNHKQPVPRGGGIAVVLTLLIFLMLANGSYFLLIGMLLLAGISLVDDIVTLGAPVRLIVQLLAVLLALQDPALNLAPMLASFLPWMPHGLAMALLAAGWLWFINLFNFMDGIDGISATEMIGISGGIVVLGALAGFFPDALTLQALAVLGAACGFLWWNWHPAKIFLGDVGSIPLGFVLGYLLLQLAAQGFLVPALILPGYYLCDSTITLMRRAWRGEKVWLAHSEHFYQQAVRGGRRHDEVARIVFGINILLLFLACFAVFYPKVDWMFLSVAYGMVIAVLFFAFARQRPEHG